jgi:putative glutathione S-transferase
VRRPTSRPEALISLRADKSGFASKQDVYEGHARALFEAYDRLDRLLADRDYLVGPGRGQLTEADVRLFPTVARQDPAYHYFFRT